MELFAVVVFGVLSLGSSQSLLPSSCAELLLQGNTKSGVYKVHPREWYYPYPFDVYCDMKTAGGGWTLFQRRNEYKMQENFFRGWEDYKIGFGSLYREFWLGNQFLYFLTNQDRVVLRIDLEDFNGNTRFAQFSHFQTSDEAGNYTLSVSGFHGNLGDSFSIHNGASFVTFDKNDVNSCARIFKGGWWYKACHASNLNGLYLKGNHSSFADGIDWESWLGYHYSLKRTEMKVRPVNFAPVGSCKQP